MKRRWLSALIGASLGLVLLGGGLAFAYHSYLLTVHQLMAGIQKASSPMEKDFHLIDVRSPEEHVTGVIPGTDMNIDYQEIGTRHREIGARLGDHVVVYCQSGRRSNIAAETLADLGYKYVYNVQGSMNAWVAAGYPVSRPGG